MYRCRFFLVALLAVLYDLRPYGVIKNNKKNTTNGSRQIRYNVGYVHVYTDSTSHRDSSTTAVTLSAVETRGPGGVKSLLDVVVVDSGSSAVVAVAPARSPLARLRTRKVQWQECDKCARSDHSSDEASSPTVVVVVVVVVV